MNVGIVGYGNLGKAIEKRIKSEPGMNLVGIFSRRKEIGTISISKIMKYADKIDTLFICVGSQSDLEKTALEHILHFNIVETFDNHAKIPQHVTRINEAAICSGKIAICSCGWDPGLFSLMRGLFSALGQKPITFWGKGLSQGHTQAIKNIPGVIDALEFTIPNQKERKKAINGECVSNAKLLHKRQCFVVAKRVDRERIERAIVNMPDYFLGYETSVTFVSLNRLNKLKSFAHRGEVITQNNVMNFSLNLASNPEFTASVAVAFARAIPKLKDENKCGAFTIFDLPLAHILTEDKLSFI